MEESYYKKNRDFLIAAATLYNIQHKEQYLQYQKEYFQRNKDILREKRRLYRQTRYKPKPKPKKEKPPKEKKPKPPKEKKRKFFVSREDVVLAEEIEEEEEVPAGPPQPVYFSLSFD